MLSQAWHGQLQLANKQGKASTLILKFCSILESTEVWKEINSRIFKSRKSKKVDIQD